MAKASIATEQMSSVKSKAVFARTLKKEVSIDFEAVGQPVDSFTACSCGRSGVIVVAASNFPA